MILPIVAYGDPVLKKLATKVNEDYPQLQTLIDNMWQTMYNAQGVGLAAPQIGQSLRIFLVDTAQVLNNKKRKNDDDDEPQNPNLPKDELGIKQVFINAQITKKFGKLFNYNEGCLSIPSIREDVERHGEIEITYEDQHFEKHTKTYNGLAARVIQHEYDHIEGVLFIDHLKALRKTMLKGRLDNISKGKVDADYRMSFPKWKR